MSSSSTSSASEVSPLFATNCSKETSQILDLIYGVQFTYGTLSIVVYALSLSVIFSNRKSEHYSSQFYLIYIWLSIVSVIVFLNNFLFFEFLALGHLCEELYSVFGTATWVLTPTYFCSYFLLFVQAFLTTLISLNRLSVVTMNLDHSRIWQRCTDYAISLCFLIPLMFIWPLAVTKVRLLPMEMGLAFSYEKWLEWIRNSQASAIVFLSTGITSFTCTILTVIRLQTIERSVKVREGPLLWFGIALSVNSAFMTMDQILIYYTQNILEDEQLFTLFYNLRYFFIDIACLSPAWSMVALSRNMRMEIMRMTGWMGEESSTTLFTPVSRSGRTRFDLKINV